MQLMADAAFPGKNVPPGFHAVAGYIGGDTPHIWTAGEWARFTRLRKLPIWTRSNPGQADPYRDAVVADRRLQALGVPPGAIVALDKETASDHVYLKHFSSGLAVAGYKFMAQYESLSVFQVAQQNGLSVRTFFWVADWTGKPHMFAKPVFAVQYADARLTGTGWDASCVRWNMYKHLWH